MKECWKEEQHRNLTKSSPSNWFKKPRKPLEPGHYFHQAWENEENFVNKRLNCTAHKLYEHLLHTTLKNLPFIIANYSFQIWRYAGLIFACSSSWVCSLSFHMQSYTNWEWKKEFFLKKKKSSGESTQMDFVGFRQILKLLICMILFS